MSARWLIAGFVLAIFAAYLPNIVQIAGIHGNYDNWMAKSRTLLFSDATRLFLFGRPVAAVTSNWPMLPLEELSDYRWLRAFSVATVCVLGVQLIAIARTHLRVGAVASLAIALAVFLVPGFSYSVLEPAAWGPHLLTILLAFAAYHILVGTNARAIPLLVSASRRDYRGLARQSVAYLGLRPVIAGCLLLQLAFYNYPPTALFLAIFPVIGLLFSRSPRPYRNLIAVRDLAFIGTNIVLYGLSAKLLYFPLVRWDHPLVRSIVGDPPVVEGEFWQKVGNTYAFELLTDLGALIGRLEEMTRAAANLWFLPQAGVHVVTALLLLVAAGLALYPRRRGPSEAADEAERLGLPAWTAAPTGIVLVPACFVLSAAPALFSIGGIVTYRTLAAPTAILGIAVMYLAAAVATRLWTALGSPREAAPTVAPKVANAAVLAIAGMAIAGTAYSNVLIMRLAANELAYYRSIVRQAIEGGARSIVMIDDRPIFLSEHLPSARDERGRWVPAYELGCFSGYCVQTEAVLRATIRMLGHSDERFFFWMPRHGDPVPGVTCEMLTAEAPRYPADASSRSIGLIDEVRRHAPVACFHYDLRWHDLSARPAG